MRFIQLNGDMLYGPIPDDYSEIVSELREKGYKVRVLVNGEMATAEEIHQDYLKWKKK